MTRRISKEGMDRAHGANVEGLVRAFGEENRETVVQVYGSIREESESTARIRDYIPILVARAAYDSLAKRLEKRPEFRVGMFS